MESVQLSQFFHQVSKWPRNQMEVDEVTERIARLLDVPFAVFLMNRPESPLGLALNGSLAQESVSRDHLIETIQNQIQVKLGNSTQVKRVQLSGGEAYGHIPASISYLTMVRLIENASQSRRDFGTVILGTVKSFTAREEVVLLAVAQRLSELARVAELESEIQMRNQFLSIASHELKAPLTSIAGMIQLEQRALGVPQENTASGNFESRQHFLKMLAAQTQRLQELVNGLFDAARAQNGRLGIEPTNTDVAALLSETVHTRLAVIANDAHVRLILDSVAQLNAWVDPIRVEEVFTNLIMNAIQSSRDGNEIRIILRDEGSAFRLIVKDQGHSISVEDQGRIFDPFEKTARASRTGGLGLGLFISREIAQLHGGTVQLVESTPGKGNVFEAYFPTKNAQLVSA